jgi:hypothetical protein
MNILSIRVVELFEILVGNLIILNKLKEAKRKFKRSFLELPLR